MRYVPLLITALLLLYDVTNKVTFDNTRAWLSEIREYAQEDVVIMLLGTYYSNQDKKVLLNSFMNVCNKAEHDQS